MKDQLIRDKYLQILQIEMEHLSLHIEEMVKDHLQKQRCGTETEHVCYENIAVLKGEECGFHSMARLLQQIDTGKYTNVDELDQELRHLFRDHIKQYGLPEAAVIFAEHKMDKVLHYCRPTGATAELVKAMADTVSD